ncbi:MAG: 4Fe-4S dicluster domain-containing protein [Candidatus Lokiarchaeota archaeon]|nr:4Fe-4S dicluster domain-containing protein [Candidatus Lokiarchaeota archaeon]
MSKEATRGHPDFSDVIAQVIDKQKCTDCGICQSVCHLTSAGVIKYERPAYRIYNDEHCKRCGFCYASCPVTSYDTSSADYRDFRGFKGNYLGIGSYRAKVPGVNEKAQDGGVVTSLLLNMIENNVVDAVLVTRILKGWEPISFITNKRDEIIGAAGSKYATNPVFHAFASLKQKSPAEIAAYGVKRIDDLRIAIVGLPCQLSGLTKMQNLGILPANLIKVKIGLFCFKNYNWTRFHDFFANELKIREEDVRKIRIVGDMTITMKDGRVLTIKPDRYKVLRNEGCAWCKDLTAHDADISCGNIGSKEGSTTVITRSKKGLDIVDRARIAGYIEDAGVVNVEEVNQQAKNKVLQAKTE